MFNEKEHSVYLNWWMEILRNRWLDHEPHVVEAIWRSRGWGPLQIGEQRTVTYGHERYEIRRLEDAEWRKQK